MRLAYTLLSYLGLVGWLILPAVLVERRRLRAQTAAAAERERRAALIEARFTRACERIVMALERSLAKAEARAEASADPGPALPRGD